MSRIGPFLLRLYRITRIAPSHPPIGTIRIALGRRRLGCLIPVGFTFIIVIDGFGSRPPLEETMSIMTHIKMEVKSDEIHIVKYLKNYILQRHLLINIIELIKFHKD